MKVCFTFCLVLALSVVSLQGRLLKTKIERDHRSTQPSQSLMTKMAHIKAAFQQNRKKTARKLADPFTDLVFTAHKILESSIHSDEKYKNITAGNIGMVLPRDAPTMVVNQLPLQRFYLNGRNPTGTAAPSFSGFNIHQRILEGQNLKGEYRRGLNYQLI